MDILHRFVGSELHTDIDVQGTDALVDNDHDFETFDILDIPASLPQSLRERLAAINECAATCHSRTNTVIPAIDPIPSPTVQKSPKLLSVACPWSDVKDWLDYTWDDWADASLINDAHAHEIVQQNQEAALCRPSTPSLWAELPFDLTTPDTLSPPNIFLSRAASISTPYTSSAGSEPAHGSTYMITEPERQGEVSGPSYQLHNITETAEEPQQPVSHRLNPLGSRSPSVLIDGANNLPSTKKRGSSAVQDSESEDPDPRQARLRRRVDHSKVEQRYRTKLKDGIRELGECIPALQSGVGKDRPSDDANAANSFAPTSNPSKGLILAKAKEYIRDLEKKVQTLEQDATIMRRQIRQLTQAASADVGQDGARAASRDGHLSKLMLAYLAGIMTTEAAFSAQQGNDRPDGKGLFAVPMPFLEGFSRSLYSLRLIKHASSFDAFLLLLKVLLLFGVVIYLAQTVLFSMTQQIGVGQLRQIDKRGKGYANAGPPALRRLAFQTAVQTIWVPDGLPGGLATVFFGVCKLGLKIVGFERITVGNRVDTFEDPDAARIKACDVLLDAQLAGGDNKLSSTRLLVTLMAAASLPETPYRRMMMALHVHLLARGVTTMLPSCQRSIWQFSNLLAGRQWNKARSPKGQNLQQELPEHLQNLLLREPAEVFSARVVQLLHDIVWQSPPMFSSAGIMCSVSGDPSIQSPLDALAALWAFASIHQVLADYLETGGEGCLGRANIANDLQSAINIAPPGSVALAYGLVARAVLVDDNPSSHIRIALRTVDALPAHLGFEGGMQYEATHGIGTYPEAQAALQTEFILPLQCAIAIALSHHRDFNKAGPSLLRCVSHPIRDVRLLGFLSLYRCLDVISKRETVVVRCTELLEQMAGLLRRLTTCDSAGTIGLGPGVEQAAAELCLRVFEWLAGTGHVDEGYMTI